MQQEARDRAFNQQTDFLQPYLARPCSVMAAHSETLQPVAGEHTLSMRWVISGRDDLVWFIGSVTVSYLFLYLYAGGLIPLLPMMAVWAVGIDGPHVFGTISRTYLDRSEWKNRKRLLLGSLLFFLVGPLLVTLGFSIEFFFVAALWAYYHLVKQHYGFMVLYEK